MAFGDCTKDPPSSGSLLDYSQGLRALKMTKSRGSANTTSHRHLRQGQSN